ncbi:serine/threonine-protein kinase [Streptomyces sp. AM8-1-1]|uniref:serine/threonine-protein kinase n=1 Tax=Streptomyces sp. AM8-1-1 TaxID=3075825 RepID=UPI0028C4BAEC|nr:serine/threonine-protein kinase [Streptomyces sp. AM8-1-1]WNO73001.1 serine/threonine-protein kinase [Streptomyces sp. AM8-1-1]
MQPLDPGEPRSIGAYRLLGRLGAGGMGRVYLGRSAGGRTVAVKIVHPHFALDEEFRARFRREVDAARRVGGQWTAPVLDADPEASVPWVATGYVAGPPLSQAVTEHGPLPAHSVRVLGAGLAEALAAVHALELVHRDVKPSNVLLTLDGPRLIDFGIARATEGTASLTSTGVSVGSPGYMSPEQILGKGITGAADVFSLGAVLAFAATGTAPFPGDSSAALLYKVVHEEPELAGLEGDLRDLVAQCLAKDPSARPSPGEIARRLAPGGAAALVAAGWLPGPLVEQVSRSAVTLLNLEPADQAVADAASGPVAFSSPAIGTFGPPVDPVGQLPSHPGGAATGPAAPPAGPPGTPPGRRRVSCTVTLTLAAALAAVTIGGGFLLDLWPGTGSGADHADTGAEPPGSSAASTPGPSTPRPSASASQEPGDKVTAVPKAFIGSWEGPFKVSLAGSELEAGTFTVVIRAGRTGATFGTVSQYDALGNLSCEDNLVLRGATTAELVADGSSSGKPGNTCTPGTHTVKLRLDGDRVQYTSREPRAGDPRATLERTD